MTDMRNWRKAIDKLFEGHPVWGQKYPDTEEGAKQFLNDISTWDVSNAKAIPDPQVDGVWKLTGLVQKTRGAGRSFKGAPVRGEAIVYLAGYKDPFGRIRKENDFESKEIFEATDELQEANTYAGAALATEKDLIVQQMPDGWWKVSVAATAGPLIHLIRTLAYSAPTQVRTKSGTKLPNYGAFKANGILMKAASRDVLDARIEKAIRKHNSYVKSETRHKERAPERKAAAAKYSADQAKQRRAEQEAKYGKGTAQRVTYRQEGGDDGYQYVVRVDGRAKWDGLTQSQAMHYAEQERNEIAKREKLGQYADKPFYPAVEEAVVQVPDGLRGEEDSRLSRRDAERFINELDPMDTPDTEVVDPESGEVLDWPDRKTRRKQENDEMEKILANEPVFDEPEDLTPTFVPPRNQDQVWDLMQNLRDSEFYNTVWQSVSELVDNPEELKSLDYDVEFDMPVSISRKDGQALTDKDISNFKIIAKYSKYMSPMHNISFMLAGRNKENTAVEFTPIFM